MTAPKRREQFIPIRGSELVDLLAAEKGPTGQDPLSPQQQTQFRRFARLLMGLVHNHYHEQLMLLKDAYAPFDPDAETKALQKFDESDRKERQDRLFDTFVRLLERANYVKLPREEMEELMSGASLWGVELDVDWAVFDRIEVYYRGDGQSTRSIRRWWKLWRKEEIQVASFQRLVLILRQNRHRRLGSDADVKSVFLKLFKDLPKMDLEMVLPGSRIKLSRLDKGMISYPLITGFGIVLYKVLHELFGFRDVTGLTASVALSWGLIAFLGGYGYRSYYSYTVKKTNYSLQLTQSLYYQNLDNNAGVLHRLLDEAEEQEAREALLAYFYLWRYAGENGWTMVELDQYVEFELEKVLGRSLDFEVDDAINKLERAGLAIHVGDRYKVKPIADAIAHLDAIWDGYFQSDGTTASPLLLPRIA